MRAVPRATWSPGEEEWVIAVPGRAGLPAKVDIDAAERRDAVCPFCPGAEATPDLYETKLIPSGYPAVCTDPAYSDAAYGRHSVFLYTSDHRGRLVDQSSKRVADVLDAIGAETTRFFEDPRVEAVFGFETSGDHFGPTVDHPHGQLIGFSFVPRRVTLADASCVICATATREHATPYVVRSCEGGLVFVPPFARWPFEMWVVPRRHVGRLAELDRGEIGHLAELLLLGLRSCLDEQDRMPQYMLTIMQAPRSDAGRHHLRLELVPLHRPASGIKRPGGVELGAGVYLNPLPPEDAAFALRGRLGGAVR